MGSGRPPIRVLIRAHLQADPKKTAVLVLLAVVMVIVYVRMFSSSETPQVAVAADPALVVPAAAASGAAQNQAPQASPRVARTLLPQPAIRELARDPFVVPSLYAQATPASTDEEPSGLTGPALEREIRTGAEQLVLQSTISGRVPLATINGRVLSPGDEIEGFVLEQIEPTSVVIRRAGVRVKLPLK